MSNNVWKVGCIAVELTKQNRTHNSSDPFSHCFCHMPPKMQKQRILKNFSSTVFALIHPANPPQLS